MAERILILYSLRPDVDREEFERWLARAEQPVVRRLEPILSYSVTRLEPSGEGEGPRHDYAEVLDVASFDEYEAGVAGDPEAQRFLGEWEGRVSDYHVVRGHVVSKVAKG